MAFFAAALGAWIVWTSAVGQVVTSPPDNAELAAVTTTPAEPVSGVKSLSDRAWKLMLSGKFDEGLRAVETDATGETAQRVKRLTAEYAKVRSAADEERQAERRRAERRVEMARLALSYAGRPVADEPAPGLPKPAEPSVYKHVEKMSEALASADKMLDLNATSRPADMRKEVGERLSKAAAETDAAVKLVGSGHGEWGQAFAKAAGEFKTALTAYEKAWGDANELLDDWRALQSASERARDELIDLGVLVSKDPLSVALARAREAKELSGEAPAVFLAKPWVKELIRDAERKGEEMMGEGKWSEALGIFGHGGLSDLDEDSLKYKDLTRKIDRHARVLNLYREKGNGGETQPAEDPDAEPLWREMISGIDTVMVRQAISQIDDNYVDAPDYRKVGISALEGVKVLVETDKAGEVFASLKDAAKRKAFVEGVDRFIEQIRKEETVDHLSIAMALNGLLDLSVKTVDLPPEVIDMEFADAMLLELDPFTAMIWPYEEEDFRKRTMGSFFGIGVQIRKDPGKPIEVVTPLADSPAIEAGIRAGDMILKIGTSAGPKETQTMQLDRAVKLITGEKDSTVELTIQRAGQPAPTVVKVKRDEIHIQTVKGWRRLADGKWDFYIDPESKIGYIRLTQFTGDSDRDIHLALRELRTGGAKGLILDMRFNPGGLLTGAINIGNEFLERGLIVKTKGRNVPASGKSADAIGEFQQGRVIVLTNQFSASAAEIVAGALKDWGRAIIIGERTYGKGSVQRLIPLNRQDNAPRRAKLKLTTAYYYLPSGRCLHRTNGSEFWGVDPDVPIPVTNRQMGRWAEIRQETDLLKEVAPAHLDKLLQQQLQEDLQLQSALLALRLQTLTE